MTEAVDGAASGAPLFLLSFRQRDGLAQAAARGGWRPVAARRRAGAEARLLASGAAVALVDARDLAEEGLAAVAALAGPAAAAGVALMVLLARDEIGQLDAFYAAGATHFLVDPADERELHQALRFAERFAERLGNAAAAPVIEPLRWWAAPGAAVVLSPALARAAGLAETVRLRALLRRLSPAGRAAFRLAGPRLRDTGLAAVAHDDPVLGRLVHHLHHDIANGRVEALVERAAATAADGPLGNEPGVRDEASGRRWLQQALKSAPSGAVHVLLIALQRFDLVNSSYGRAAGDALLRGVGRRLEVAGRESLGAEAIVARLGGSAFLIAARGEPRRAELAASAVAETLARPFAADGRLASIGALVALATGQPGDNPATLLRRAAEALAEPEGGSVRRASGGPAMEGLAANLRQALDRDEVEILFQPQVALATGRIVGVEALARWRHSVLGELGAETLLAAADRAGLGTALSDHIQTRALALAARWPAALGGLRLSINLTAADIGRAGFADLLLERVDASGFPRERLTAEITESGLIDDLGAAARLFTALRAAGCRVALDDFGTGYSSLAYLTSLPLDYLKLDRDLSQDIEGSPRDRIVVRSVIAMARALGLAVIAEGVETAAQLDLLAREGCGFYQGFLCAPALSSSALAAFVPAWRSTVSETPPSSDVSD